MEPENYSDNQLVDQLVDQPVVMDHAHAVVNCQVIKLKIYIEIAYHWNI